MQRAILSSAAKKVAEIDEITIYGMLTTGRLICKCIDVFAYKSASTYLPLTGDMGLFRTVLNSGQILPRFAHIGLGLRWTCIWTQTCDVGYNVRSARI